MTSGATNRRITANVQSKILSGEGNLPRWFADPSGPKFGVVLQVLTVPPGFSLEFGDIVKWREDLITLTLYAPMFTGTEVIVQQLASQLELVAFTFTTFLISRVHYRVLPGCEFTWSYLQLH